MKYRCLAAAFVLFVSRAFAQGAELNPKMTRPEGEPIELSELLILSPQIEGSLSSLTEERRKATEVTDAVGSEQMAKSGDGNAAAALKRVSGLSVMGGKYIYVRGLGERYSSTLFNGAILPSPEPSRRVVPLDIFPTGILGSVVVKKTYAPNLGCEFGGGVVEMTSRTVPDKPTVSYSLSLGHASGTTFSHGKSYKGGELDWAGFDDGSRSLPKSIQKAKRVTQQTPSNPSGFSEAQLERAGEELPNVYSPESVTIPPDIGISMMGGGKTRALGFDLGLMSSLMFSNGWDNETFFETDLADPARSGHLSPVKRYDTNLTQNKVRLGGMAVLEAGREEKQKLEFVSAYLHSAKKGAAVSRGFDLAEGDDTERRKVRLSWIENTLLIEQVRGEHDLGGGDDFPLKWNYTYAVAKAGDLARRSYTQEQQNEHWVLRGLPKRVDSSLIDTSHNFLVDTVLPVYLDDTKRFDIATGFGFLTRSREANLRRLKWVGGSGQTWTSKLETTFAKKNIGPENEQFHIEEDTVNTDQYGARQQILGGYGTLIFDIQEWTLSTGLRLESSKQSVETKDFHSADDKKVQTKLDGNMLSPVLSLTWEGIESLPLRIAYSRTVARPDFKELSPAPFWDDRNDSMTRGNPKLRVTQIDNYDVRLERYLSATENVSVGGFYKQFKDPVEVYQTGALDRAISYRNAEGAYNAGLEVDGRKELSDISTWFSGVSISGNYTRIYSRVDLGDGSGYQTSSKRPLQGQSPYVFNLSVEYENAAAGFTLSTLYNVSGERIIELGAQGEPDIYEQPAHLVDVVASQKLGAGMTLKLQLKNILGSDVVAKQRDKVVSREYGDLATNIGVSGSF